MGIQFATCDRQRALGFLRKLFPSRAIEDTPESAGPVLDFVAADIIRIGDPDFHGGQVFASKGTPEQIAAAIGALTIFQSENAKASRKTEDPTP